MNKSRAKVGLGPRLRRSACFAFGLAVAVVPAGAAAVQARSNATTTAASTVRVKVAKHPLASTKRHSHPYTITVRGNAASASGVYLFVDYRKCADTPSVEATQGGAPAQGFPHQVSGKFRIASHNWRSKLRKRDHACVYLVDTASGTVVAHAFKGYRVH